MKIAVSACLLGEPCRYDGKSCPNEAVQELADVYTLVPICPEQLGGLGTPRVPCEIQMNGRVVDKEGVDRTAEFHLGAVEALKVYRREDCRIAILKENSPSCGLRKIYDGSFTGKLVDGRGVTATLFTGQGVTALSENELHRL